MTDDELRVELIKLGVEVFDEETPQPDGTVDKYGLHYATHQIGLGTQAPDLFAATVDLLACALLTIESLADERAGITVAMVRCIDCGMLYREFGLDTTLPHEQWLMIHPQDGGVLCASCIVKRAARLPGVIALRAVIEFAKEP